MSAPAEPLAPAPGDRLVGPTFVWVVLSGLGYFAAIGMLLPVIPRYVEDELAGGGIEVGLGVGAFAVSAALLRPLAGRLGDRWGRRPLAVLGALIAGASVLLYGIVATLVWLVLMRLVTGIGEACFFIGAATAAQDLAPDHRRGEAASYFSIAIYGGLAAGPFVGELLYRRSGPDLVWLVAAGLLAVSALFGLLIPGDLGRDGDDDGPSEPVALLHPVALVPGVVLLLGLFGFAAFSSFLPLYVDDIGIDDAGPFFLVYGIAVLVVRIFGAKIPDRFGAVPTATTALVAVAVGVVAIGAFRAPAVLYAGTVVFAVGMALLFPALFGLVVNRAPNRERSHAVGTFSLFFDVSQGVGAPLLGLVVTLSGTERSAFFAAGVVALAGIVVARHRIPAGD